MHPVDEPIAGESGRTAVFGRGVAWLDGDGGGVKVLGGDARAF